MGLRLLPLVPLAAAGFAAYHGVRHLQQADAAREAPDAQSAAEDAATAAEAAPRAAEAAPSAVPSAADAVPAAPTVPADYRPSGCH
eukprot:2550884-Prymnesium_polylepis.2